MADDWLKMRKSLRDDPAVIQMAAALGCPEDLIVGQLAHFWGWVDTQLRSGDATALHPDWIDRYVGAIGFATALESVGWLTVSGGVFAIPDFDAYFSKNAKRRALAARRQAKYRRNAPALQKASPDKTRQDKTDNRPSVRPSCRARGKREWKKIRALADRSQKKLYRHGKPFPATEGNAKTMLCACALVVGGQMAEAWLADAIQATIDKPQIRNTGRFLRGVLLNKCKDLDVNFDVMMASVEIPAGILDAVVPKAKETK